MVCTASEFNYFLRNVPFRRLRRLFSKSSLSVLKQDGSKCLSHRTEFLLLGNQFERGTLEAHSNLRALSFGNRNNETVVSLDER